MKEGDTILVKAKIVGVLNKAIKVVIESSKQEDDNTKFLIIEQDYSRLIVPLKQDKKIIKKRR